MQKFTRAITREIEVGGERLAVTLDADGLSVRPVGSRRPAHALDWAAVVCACAGGGHKDLAAALTALRGGAAPVPRADLSATLAGLDTWLAKHRARYHKALNPGATPKQLEALEKALGRPLPDEVRTWLSWHNGQKEGIVGCFVEAFYLLGTEQIAAACQEQKKAAGDDWNAGWLPLLADDQDDFLVVDTGAAAATAGKGAPPVREIWQGQQEHEVISPSLAAWAEGLLRDLEAGAYTEDPERGEMMRTSDEEDEE